MNVRERERERVRNQEKTETGKLNSEMPCKVGKTKKENVGRRIRETTFIILPQQWMIITINRDSPHLSPPRIGLVGFLILARHYKLFVHTISSYRFPMKRRKFLAFMEINNRIVSLAPARRVNRITWIQGSKRSNILYHTSGFIFQIVN